MRTAQDGGAREFVKIAATGVGHWIVAKVNTEDLPGLGTELARQTGAMPAARIKQFVEQAAGTTR